MLATVVYLPCMKQHFDHVRDWVFDLDNTLYPPSARLFDQMEVLMTDWIVQNIGVERHDAHDMRDGYLRDYGTTLAGLLHHHGIEPDPFLDHAHELDLSALVPAPDLHAAIAALPGRKIVYTNGTRKHAHRVIAARGLQGLFDAVYGIEDADYLSKPSKDAFGRVFHIGDVDTAHGAMFEDSLENLEVPHALGMRTVWIGPTAEDEPDFVDFATNDLTGFLMRVNAGLAGE
ncbi:hypothetical protein POI8812_01224 [Pontivivens insulae]|uniref:Phosphoglycolate phosphatase n=2 Tax=Pontivivens insulae TaxID=1639689 RepID=A0A2R8A9J4_9RHOB|nr:putative hydrolase of the HAD superfamily [Pontivivens insulae]SPF28921.1 hypothetical protein POI8812_01224 [Pontivivens insulae]